MLRRFVCLIWAVSMAMVLRVPVFASEGSIQVIPRWCEAAVSGGTVTISRIGTRDGQDFRITDGLADWILTEQEVTSESFLKEIQFRFTKGQDCLITGDNGAVFEKLPEGLYLITQTDPAEGYFPFVPFLVELSSDRLMQVTAEPPVIRVAEIPKTGDYPAPIIGAMGIGLSVALLMVLADGRKK